MTKKDSERSKVHRPPISVYICIQKQSSLWGRDPEIMHNMFLVAAKRTLYVLPGQFAVSTLQITRYVGEKQSLAKGLRHLEVVQVMRKPTAVYTLWTFFVCCTTGSMERCPTDSRNEFTGSPQGSSNDILIYLPGSRVWKMFFCCVVFRLSFVGRIGNIIGIITESPVS